MRAILIATGGRNGAEPLIDRYPDSLLPLLDRPFLQHVVEYLARQGIRRFDIVLSHRPEAVEGYFGDGTRWGCQFTYHLARDPGRPYRVLKMIDRKDDEILVLGHADRLPAFAIEEIGDPGDDPLPLVDEDDTGRITWTGWAVIPSSSLPKIDADWSESDLADHLLALPIDHVVERVLDTGSFDAMLNSQCAVLDKNFAPLFLTGREIEPGVWISRNVSLHPTAKVVAPVFVGEDCHIGPGVQVGPHAAVGRGCILGRDSTVSRSLIFPENYIGADLELSNVIVDRNRILRGEHTITEADAFLLGSLSAGGVGRSSAGTVSRLLALALLAVSLPVLLVMAVFLRLTRSGPVFYRTRAVVLPQAPGSRRRTCTLWSFHRSGASSLANGELAPSIRGLLLIVLPALINIVRGELRFAGVAPRTPEEVNRLPIEWRTLYLSCKSGLFTEAASRGSGTPTLDERYAAEAYYAAMGDWRYDLRLILGYLYRAVASARVASGCPVV
jgi:lipopolysaccharide/colanic/teichoic acid biosynthesis glycosyltransferase